MKKRIQFLLAALGFFMIGFAQAQSGQISGQITDESGAPLPGASVVIKETNIGTTTDFDGNFSIDEVAEGSYQLIVSCYRTTVTTFVGCFG